MGDQKIKTKENAEETKGKIWNRRLVKEAWLLRLSLRPMGNKVLEVMKTRSRLTLPKSEIQDQITMSAPD